jgi:DNA polymerase-3 subunit gamma/tau
MTQAYYRKWRPQTWDQVIGQQHIVITLRNAIAHGKQGHAYLFAGPRGTGKTSIARILAKAVNCLEEDLAARPCDQCDHCQAVNRGSFLDLIEIDAASNTSVEDVRDLRDKINFSPNQGRYKIYIIDEVHMLSTAAFNALLKTLEEPPPHAIFVLATTEVHKIPATVLSRCQRHEFRRIPVVDMVAHLKAKAAEEGIQIDPEAVLLVARQATGSLRDAISLLDQLSSLGGQITLEAAQSVLGTATSQAVLDVIDALQAGDPGKGMDALHATLDAGSDPRQFARQMVEYLRGVMLVKMGNAAQVDVGQETRQHMAGHAQHFSGGDLLRVIRAFNRAATEARGVWQPSLPLELAFIEALEAPAPQPEASPGTPPQPTGSPKKQASTASSPPPVAKASKADQAAPTSEQEKHWKEIVAEVRKVSPNTTGLLNPRTCQHAWKDDVLYLYFTSELLKDKMEQESHLALLKQAAEKVLGAQIEVRCSVSGGSGSLPDGLDSSGRVAAAMRLGGTIVDINELGSQSEESD